MIVSHFKTQTSDNISICMNGIWVLAQKGKDFEKSKNTSLSNSRTWEENKPLKNLKASLNGYVNRNATCKPGNFS